MQGTNSARPYLTWFHCEAGECKSKFPTKDELRSHTRFFHWQVGWMSPNRDNLSKLPLDLQ